MSKRAIAEIILTLLLTSVLSPAFSIYPGIATSRPLRAHDEMEGFAAIQETDVDNWPMFRHNNMRTGYTESVAPTTNNTLWMYSREGSWLVTSPVVADGMVFVGDERGSIYAFDETTGESLWNSSFSRWPWTPAFSNGKVVFGTVEGFLYSLESTDGTVVWETDLGDPVESSPAISGGTIYVGTLSGKVFALNQTNAEIIWQQDIGYECALSPALANGTLFVEVMDPYPKAYLYALDSANGNVKWSFNYTRSFGYPGWWQQVCLTSPSVSNGKVYTGADGIFCLDATSGEAIWQNTTIYVWSSPSVHNGKVFFGGSTGWYDKQYFYAFDQNTGALTWQHEFDDIIFSSPAISGGLIYMASHGYYGSKRSYVYSLNETNGHQVWSYDTTDEQTMTSPAVSDGKLFLTTPHNIFTFADTLPSTIDELKTQIEKSGFKGEIDNQGIVKSLIAKLNVAQKLVDKGKIDEAKSILQNDFIPQVQNLSGTHITAEAAEVLVKSAEHTLSHL